MAISTSSNFATLQASLGYQPVFLVELPDLGAFYATRLPSLGNLTWRAGQGLLAGGSGIQSGENLPTYESILAPLRSGGVGSVNYQLDGDGFARTGQSSVQLLNQEYVNKVLQPLVLENTFVRIRMGFLGGNLNDYITIFSGVVDSATATYDALDLALVDDTTRNIVPVPPQFGTDFFPRAFEQGDSIQIVLGDQFDVPATQIIGAVDARLAFQIGVSSTELSVFGVNHAFPPTGEVTVTSGANVSTVTYDRVFTKIVFNQIYLTLRLTAAPSFTHEPGAVVALSSYPRKFVAGFRGLNVRRVRGDNAATASAATVATEAADPAGGDPRQVHSVSFTADEENVTVDMASEARGPNKVLNGNFDNSTDGWTALNGVWNRFLPASTFDYVYRGQVLNAQAVQSTARSDWTVDPNKPHRLTFTTRMGTNAPPFVSVAVGTTTNSTAYFSFGQITDSAEVHHEITFLPTEATVRITLVVDFTGVGVSGYEAYFDQFDLYDIATENPATQIEHLIKTHLPTITPDPASFSEAFGYWDIRRNRMAGVIQQTEEAQALLGRLAQQFRAKTFLNEEGRQKMVVFDQSRPPVVRFDAANIAKGSMRVSKTRPEEVYTHIYVYFNRTPSRAIGLDLGGRGAFRGVVYATPLDTNHTEQTGLSLLCEAALTRFRKERTLEVFADMVPDVATAEDLLEYLVRRYTHQRYVVEFDSFLNAAHVEVADFVQVNHILLPDEANGGRFEVTAKAINPNGCTTSWVAEQINPFLFGAYKESWEPLAFNIPVQVVAEQWEIGPPPVIDESNPCNPYTESWDSLALRHRIGTSDGVLINDRALSRSLQAQWNFRTFDGVNTADLWPRNIPHDYIGSPYAAGSRPVPFLMGNSRVPLGDQLPGFPRLSGAGNLSNLDVNALGTNLHAYRFTDIVRVLPVVGYDVPVAYSANRQRTTRSFTVSAVVKLTEKGRSYTIMENPFYFAGPATNPSTDTPHNDRFAWHWIIFYDGVADRYRFGVGCHQLYAFDGTAIPQLDTIVSAQTVTANAYGSPSTTAYHQITCTWDAVTSTISIQVNAGTANTAVITPGFTTHFGNMMIIGEDHAAIVAENLVGSNPARPSRAYIGLPAFWQRKLSASEVTAYYNGGTYMTFPF